MALPFLDIRSSGRMRAKVLCTSILSDIARGTTKRGKKKASSLIKHGGGGGCGGGGGGGGYGDVGDGGGDGGDVGGGEVEMEEVKVDVVVVWKMMEVKVVVVEVVESRFDTSYI